MNDMDAKSMRSRRLLLVAAFLLGLGVALFAVVVVGLLVGQNPAIEKIENKILKPALARFQSDKPVDEETIAWNTLNTHFFKLEVARINLSPRGEPAIWALEDVGGDILFATRLGQFGFLDTQNRVRRLDGLKVQMGVEELTQSPLFQDPIFQISEVRTLDLLSIPTGENTYDLYVSHHRFRNECFELVVSRARLVKGDEGLRAVSQDWEDIYVTDPCIPVKNIGMRFAGHEGGGRLAQLDAETLLLSIGVHQFDGTTGPFQAGQDDANDLGKIIEISTKSGDHSVYARGFRNPQGLLVASDGRIWESEHGPRGGDEINLIQRDKNYGWPIVTYGTDYDTHAWPFNPNPGQHTGYERPRFAFVPSVGISNMIEPSAQEFPDWSEHLLVASLAGNKLFAVKTEGDDITYSEPIEMGERMRDMISLSDGRIAIISDSGVLLLLRNGERHDDEPEPFVVSGLLDRPQLLPAEAIPTSTEVKGARVFFYYCGTCHSATGESLAGPPLNGVIGRNIAAVDDYPYSATLKEARGRWTPSQIRKFISHEGADFEGTTMPAVSLYKDQFEAMVTYLRTTEETPRQAGN